jgi:hypothetical protein
MQKKTTVWYTLGEAEKATSIHRTRLDHACRERRAVKLFRKEMISFRGRPREEMVTLAVTMYAGRSTPSSSTVSATTCVIPRVLQV